MLVCAKTVIYSNILAQLSTICNGMQIAYEWAIVMPCEVVNLYEYRSQCNQNKVKCSAWILRITHQLVWSFAITLYGINGKPYTTKKIRPPLTLRSLNACRMLWIAFYIFDNHPIISALHIIHTKILKRKHAEFPITRTLLSPPYVDMVTQPCHYAFRNLQCDFTEIKIFLFVSWLSCTFSQYHTDTFARSK